MLNNPQQNINAPVAKISDALQQKHFPSLNGLRGVAILMVVICHLRLSWSNLYRVIFNGPLGVSIFFVLSGFLITTLCLKEIQQTAKLSLKDFYIRRALRILPVSFLYIFIIFIADRIFSLHIAWYQYLATIFYLQNFNYFIRNRSAVEFGHFWSLAIEEQFYILFPFLLKRSYKAFLWAVILIVAALPLLCSLQEICAWLNRGVFYAFTHYFIKFQSIAVGCLYALLAAKNFFDNPMLLRYKLPGNIIAIFLIYYLWFDPFYSIGSVWVNLVIAILIGYVIITNVVPATDWIYQFLNLRVMSFIGVLSYSVYIWQQIFTFGEPKFPAIVATFPYNVVFLIAVSCLSYFCYEKYFLKFKAKFTRVKSIQ